MQNDTSTPTVLLQAQVAHAVNWLHSLRYMLFDEAFI